MKETMEIFVENYDESTALVMQQLVDLLKQENVQIAEVNSKEDSESKSIFVTSIVVPLVVGLTSTFIYDAIKLAYSRLAKHIHEKKTINVRMTNQDGSVSLAAVEIGNDKKQC